VQRYFHETEISIQVSLFTENPRREPIALRPPAAQEPSGSEKQVILVAMLLIRQRIWRNAKITGEERLVVV
jgi:hypothetical protein